MKRPTLFWPLTLAAAVPGQSAPARDLPARVARFAARYTAPRPKAAVAVGIYQAGKTWVGGYGSLSATEPRAPDGDTLYELGSITKVFTGLLFADAIAQGALAVDDRLAARVPEGIELEAGDREKITLLHLATHGSGLPRLPADFWERARGHEGDPYAGYTVADLFASVQNAPLERPAGLAYSYSNYGVALLGQICAQARGAPYPELVTELVFRPLGMVDTCFEIEGDRVARLAPPHAADGGPAQGWHFDGFAPAGAAVSSVHDLLRFFSAAVHPGDDRLGAALRASMQVRASLTGQPMGLCWHQLPVLGDHVVWWHNGGTGGYATFMAVEPAQELGVVVLSNYGDALAGRFDVDQLGLGVLAAARAAPLQ